MAKYSKEQRRCAVELYVRYECCAADMVRELGYPSREASRMWHRDWLEEQRTGVPSTRGERYARYTTEQKRAAVDHYLTHGRRASRTMRRLGYPSKEVLAAWIDELAPGERHVRRGPGPRRAQTPGSTPATATGLPTPEGRVLHGIEGQGAGECGIRRQGHGIEEAEGGRQMPQGGHRRDDDLPARRLSQGASPAHPHEQHDRTSQP